MTKYNSQNDEYINNINNNKMVLDIYKDNSTTCKKLVAYWNKNYEVNWEELEKKYGQNKRYW